MSVAGVAHAVVELTSCVYVYERGTCQNVIYSAHKMDRLDQLPRYVLQRVNLLFAHCKNKKISLYLQ
jgi:hypothetical protein